jgi:hypothetical protein
MSKGRKEVAKGFNIPVVNCDICGEEASSWNVNDANVCEMCGKDICKKCSKIYTYETTDGCGGCDWRKFILCKTCDDSNEELVIQLKSSYKSYYEYQEKMWDEDEKVSRAMIGIKDIRRAKNLK